MRRKTPQIGKHERNYYFYDRYVMGESQANIADFAGLSRSTVGWIVGRCAYRVLHARTSSEFAEEIKKLVHVDEWVQIERRLIKQSRCALMRYSTKEEV